MVCTVSPVRLIEQYIDLRSLEAGELDLETKVDEAL
jgi:hypothetical protein